MENGNFDIDGMESIMSLNIREFISEYKTLKPLNDVNRIAVAMEHLVSDVNGLLNDTVDDGLKLSKEKKSEYLFTLVCSVVNLGVDEKDGVFLWV